MLLVLGSLSPAFGGIAGAEEVTVAVAANFIGPSRALEGEFEAATGHEVELTSGSTGRLYALIVNGAPFDVLLAADRERPRRLAEEGFGDAASVFTYAVGRLVLWSAQAERIGERPLADVLDDGFRWFAIAEPEVAPYGAAAKQALEALGAWESTEPCLVRGQNIAQTFAMVETRNAELGLVALSRALSYDGHGFVRGHSAGVARSDTAGRDPAETRPRQCGRGRLACVPAVAGGIADYRGLRLFGYGGG